MPGKLTVYLDLASLYSYVYFAELQTNLKLLSDYGVDIDIVPVLLGAINVGSGNKPPWTLPAKASYGSHDARRSLKRVGMREVQTPPDFNNMTMTVLPLRALHFIKQNHPAAVFRTAFHYLFHSFWTLHRNNTIPDVLRATLAEIPAGFQGAESPGGGGRKLFAAGQVDAIVKGATSQQMKDALREATQQALDRGAFGAPWIWAANGKGDEEPFFGSDSHFIYDFLDVPYTCVQIIPPDQHAAEKSKL